ncbi:MAG: TetR/AcrR family transcriptional regulator [Candidatus Eremiobacteraeota bacterium]|nr:TetR/AcrR family transcriptional regulator [Candidatus Eremiobacteraeota bacterium]
MSIRDQILAAAARVYAEHGFRGATTRRIADAAGVNEVTLFRTYGSKAALIEAALRHTGEVEAAAPHALPDVPRDPERELAVWTADQLEHLRSKRALIRQAMNDFEARPDAACATHGWDAADAELHRYLVRLGEYGFVAWDADPADTADMLRVGRVRLSAVPPGSRREDVLAAAAMFMAALFSDAMGRDMMPQLYPQPAERAPALYVRLFLRALDCTGRTAGLARRPGGRSPHRAPSSTEAA